MISDAQLKTLADYIVAGLAARGAAAVEEVRRAAALDTLRVPSRLTLQQFGTCVGLVPDVVARKCRQRDIERKHVHRGHRGRIEIDQAALATFEVPLELAAERLRAAGLLAEQAPPATVPQSPLRSAA